MVLYHYFRLFLCCLVCSLSAGQTCSSNSTLNLSPGRECNCVNSEGSRSLSEIFAEYKSIVQPEDCLFISFKPGTYSLFGLLNAIDYSVVLLAPQGGVTLTCTSTCSAQSESTCSSDTSSAESQLKFAGVGLSVKIEGIEFRDCEQPISFDELNYLSIKNSTFVNISGSAVDIFNCLHTEIDYSIIRDSWSVTGKAQYRGNAGGLSIAFFHNVSFASEPNVSIRNSVFRNNRALLPRENVSRQQIDLALNNQYYYGRGGGLGFFVNEFITNVTVEVLNCTFEDNFAESFGGGMYIYIDGDRTHHSFTTKWCHFQGNKANPGSFGGGVQVAFLNRNSDSPPSECIFEECFFNNNTAAFGGGLSAVQVYSQGKGNNVSVARTIFENNTASNVGSGMMFASLLYVQNRVRSIPYVVEDCHFRWNTAPGGTFGAGFIHVNFYGNNTFEYNSGSGLRLAGSLAGVQGNLTFVGNNAENVDGGALYISAFGQVKLYRGSVMDFINNTGRVGAAIVVQVQRSSVVYSELIFNPQCFLLHENTTLAPNLWDDVKVRFMGNSAQVGPAVYISHLSLCSWFSVEQVNNQIDATFNSNSFTQWTVFEYIDGSNTAFAHNSTSQKYYFQTEPVRVVSRNDTSTPFPLRPGQIEKLSLLGIDQLGNPTYLIARLSDSRGSINSRAFSQAGDTVLTNMTDMDVIHFTPSLLPVQPSDQSVDISYGFANVNLVDNIGRFDVGDTIQVVIDTPYNVRSARNFNFSVILSDCLPGYVLNRRVEEGNFLICSCVNSDFSILTCDPDNSIVLRDGYWASSESEPFPHLDLTICPASYCSCYQQSDQSCETLFFQDDPDRSRQCHATRSGALCGKCVNGTGVGVLRPYCRECSGSSYWTLGFLVLGDFLLSSIILILSVLLRYSFPHSLKGFLFYIQTVYYTTEFFPSSFWNVRQYMLYFGSFFGLYFPWDFCLHPGMSSISALGLTFIPAVVATVVVTVTVILLFCFGKHTSSLSHLLARAKKRIGHGIWALLLLLYAPLVHTCAMLLHCPRSVAGSYGDEIPVWFLDGEVECFRDPLHSALGTLAIIVLLLLVLLIPAVFFFTMFGSFIINKLHHSNILESMLEALSDGYKEEAKWWAAWELLRRLLLIVIVVALPGRTVAPLYIIAPCFAFHIFYLPYRKWWQNATEAMIFIDYLVLLLLRSTQTFLDAMATYSGTGIPSSQGTSLAATNKLTWWFFVFFYLPLFYSMCFCVGWTVRSIGVYAYRKQRPRTNTAFENVGDVSVNFYSQTRGGNVTTTELDISYAQES